MLAKQNQNKLKNLRRRYKKVSFGFVFFFVLFFTEHKTIIVDRFYPLCLWITDVSFLLLVGNKKLNDANLVSIWRCRISETKTNAAAFMAVLFAGFRHKSIWMTENRGWGRGGRGRLRGGRQQWYRLKQLSNKNSSLSTLC